VALVSNRFSSVSNPTSKSNTAVEQQLEKRLFLLLPSKITFKVSPIAVMVRVLGAFRADHSHRLPVLLEALGH
jgi:hypothetical protein